MYNIINYNTSKQICTQKLFALRSSRTILAPSGPFQVPLNESLTILIDFLRFQYPYDYSKPTVNAQFPGPKHQEALETVQSYNLDQVYQVCSFLL